MQTAIQTITRFYESFNSNYYYLPKKIQGKSTTSSQAEKKKKMSYCQKVGGEVTLQKISVSKNLTEISGEIF